MESFKKIDLENGYSVDIYNASRQVGLDASHVKLILKMETLELKEIPLMYFLVMQTMPSEFTFSEMKLKRLKPLIHILMTSLSVTIV